MSAIWSRLVNLGGLITGTLPVANGGSGVTTSTGTVAVVLSTSPTLVTPTLGAATATSVTFSPTTGGIVGTTTNDDAGAGKVGEFPTVVSRLRSASTAITTDVVLNVTASPLSLTAGDWMVFASLGFTPTTTTSMTQFVIGVSLTSATLPALDVVAVPTSNEMRMQVSSAPQVTGVSDTTVAVPGFRVTLSGTTSLYLVARSTFSVSTLAVYGSIWARRVR